MSKTSTTQSELLHQLKTAGPQTVTALASVQAMTTMGVRQHLDQLRSQGLVRETAEVRQQRGRPVRSWKLTQAGHMSFPDSHSLITTDLINSVRKLFGEDGLDRVIESRSQETRVSYQAALVACVTIEAKLKTLVSLRCAEGYMAEYHHEDSGTFTLVENHCPICAAATTCEGFCRAELEVFQSLFKGVARVERTQHLLHGARRCSYSISPIVA